MGEREGGLAHLKCLPVCAFTCGALCICKRASGADGYSRGIVKADGGTGQC